MAQICLKRVHQLQPNAQLLMITQSPDTLSKLSSLALPVNIFLSRKAWHQERNILGKLYKILPPCFELKLGKLETYLRVSFPNLCTKWINYRMRHNKALINLSNEYIQLIHKADVVISSGGGFITDAFEEHAINILEMLYLAHKLGKPTALFGQGIGPVTSLKLLTVMKRVLPTVDLITLREKVSGLPILLDLGVNEKQVIVTGDDAIELASTGRQQAKGNKIGFNIRVAKYASVNSDQDVLSAAAIKVFAKAKNTHVCSIPISWYPAEHDLNQINNLFYHEIQSDEQLSHYNIDELVKRISECRIMVTGSYHAGVFALSQGIPVIGLARSQYYVDKFNGLSDMFPSGVSVICFNDLDWSDRLSKALDDLWNNAELLRHRIIEEADKQIKLSKIAYEQFFSETIYTN